MAGGGHSGKIDITVEHELYVSPTVGSEFNTYRPAFFPVACWHIYDIRFEFDSSFVLPDSQDEMAELKRLCAEHPESPMSVFGHADPVGDEVYNKTLSGRRAKSVHDLILRDIDGWEELYSKPFGGDVWGQKAYGKMLEAVGLPANHPNNKANRADVFQKYMDFLCGDFKVGKDRFLARGADPDGKGDYQGCSEFNPLLLFSQSEDKEFQKAANKNKRNQENAPNRRVIIYLFRPKAIVSAGKWPCPTWKEGVAGCKKRFWSDSSKRVALGADRRTYDATKDTFACRFYDRIASASPCESLQAPPSLLKIWNLKWTPAEGFCGDKVKLTGETNLVDGTPIKIKLTTKAGNVSKLVPFDVTPTGGKFEHEMEIKNVGFDQGGTFLEKVEIEAAPDDASITVEGVPGLLKVKAMIEAAEDTYVKDRNGEWGAAGEYVNHSEFKQKIEKFRNKVTAKFNFVKTWGGYHVDLSADGVSGTVDDGPPWDGYRWAKADPANPMNAGSYWDGSAWVAMPAGFSGSYSSVGFKKDGSDFVPVDGGDGKWPEAFTDYDPDAAEYANKRQAWVDFTHAAWTDKLQLHRKDCHSDAKVRCCLYDVEVNISFNKVATWTENQTISISPGGQRANAAHWFYDRPGRTAAHETGHHLDNPDEYSGGAIDPALNVPGEVTAGIDTAGDSLMGGGNTVKKRHFRAFETMEKKLIKTKYGREYTYETVDP
jgi:hypothetical protein